MRIFAFLYDYSDICIYSAASFSGNLSPCKLSISTNGSKYTNIQAKYKTDWFVWKTSIEKKYIGEINQNQCKKWNNCPVIQRES